ncbi:hypothetical protein BCR36DRAFT_328855, partial [Piromyces finnis]
MEFIWQLIFFLLIYNIYVVNAHLNTTDEKYSKFIIEIYGEEDELLDKFHLNYDFLIHKFEEDALLKKIPTAQYIHICNENDLKEKNKEDIEILILWDTNKINEFYKSLPYLNAYPNWYTNIKKQGKTFCFRIDNVGWKRNAYEEICDSKNKTIACPNLIIVGTTQLTYRYQKEDVANINKYINNYYKKNGVSFESLLNKYSSNDYRIDNNWLAIPVLIDLRILKFNETTFDYCNKKGYDLHYPP